MIKCLTLNPSLDTGIFTDQLGGRDLKAKSVTYKIAGKAMNAADALIAAGHKCRSVVFLGNAGGFADLKKPHEAITHSRAIRQNFSIYEGDKLVSHVRAPFQSSLAELRPVLDWVRENTSQGDVLVVAGSLPDLNPVDRAILINEMTSLAKPLILDVSSLTLKDLETIRPHTIKVNSSEFSKLASIPHSEVLTTVHLEQVHRLTKAAIIVTQGAHDVLAISKDSDPVVFSIAPQFVSDAPSMIGSGDAFLAGYVSGISAGATFHNSVRRGIIFGVARQRDFDQDLVDFGADALFDLEFAPVVHPCASQ
jgi:fructose-1-phosphate kinase PfkB-like protein